METDKIILLDEDNNILDINSLMADDVITYCKNGNYIFGYVTRKVASGVVNELNISEQIIVVDGVEFKVSGDKSSLYSYAKINDSVLLYLDAFGNISGINVSAQSDSSKFYLPIKLYKNDHPTGNVIGLKFFDISEHAIKQIELSDKINLNGTSGLDVESNYTNINNALTFISYAPIMLKINSDDKITRIDTSKDASSYSQDEDGLTVLANGEELYYRANVNSFEAKAYTDSSTKIIIIPSDMNGVEAEDFKVLSTIASNTYTVSAFSSSKNKPNASVVTMRNSDYASMPSRPGTGIITKITDVIDEDGGDCKKVYYKTSTETVSFIIDNPELQDVFNPSATTYGYYRPPIKAKELVVGDIISVVVSDKNTLENFNCYWKSDTEVLKSKEQIYRANNRMVICQVEKVDGEYIVYNAKIRTSDTDATENHYERREFLPISGLVVQMIEKNGSQVKITDSDVSEILEGDIIIYNSEAYVPKKVFILRGLTKTFDELNNEEPII